MTTIATRPAACIASQIIPVARITLRYADALTKDIPAAKFAHMPHPTMNHPAFNIGHLSIYPNRILTLVGKPHLAVDKPGYEGLFKAGVACVEQDGRYPAKEEIVAYFMERHQAATEAIADVPDEVFLRGNPVEGRFREMCPTIGAAVNFLLTGHPMSHLGQISSWRRALGLPSVM